MSTVTPVFVSSTWIDLQPERAAVEAALDRLPDFKFIGMEYFGSDDASTRAVSLAEVDASGLYLGIIGGRYGSGITVDEYNRAHELGLFSLLYFKKDAAITTEQRDAEPEKQAQLAALKTELRKRHLIVEFERPDELAVLVLADLHKYAQRRRAPGSIVAATNDEYGYRVRTGSLDGALVQRHSGKLQLRLRPLPLRPSIGRVRKLLDRTAEVSAAKLALQAATPVEVYGEEGVGKTSLLKHLAQQLAAEHANENFPAGALYHGQVGETPAADLLQFVFEAVYETDQPYKPRLADLQKLLYDQRLLIMLDDVRMPRAELEALLDNAPNCCFMLTAPERHLVGDLRGIQLTGLPSAEAVSLLESTLGRVLSESERADAARLCDVLEGHPLHIQQAALQAQEHGWLLSELLGKLQAAAPAAVLNQQALNEASEPERGVVAALAALGGAAVNAEILAGLTGLADIHAVLVPLQEKRLIEERGTAYGLTGELEEVLPHAANLDAWRTHALNWFSDWAVAQQADPRNVAAAVPAMLSLLHWANGQGRHSEVIRLGQALDAPLTLTGQWEQWKQVIELVQASARARNDRVNAAWALHQLGTRALCQNAEAEARQLLQAALAERQAVNDDMAVRATQHNLSTPIKLPPLPTAPPSQTARPSLLRRMLPWAAAGLLLIGGGVYGGKKIIEFIAGPTPTPTPSPASSALVPRQLNFGEQRLNTASAPQQVTLTNPAAVPLTLAALTLNKDAAGNFRFTDDDCSRAAVPPNGQCSFRVSFAPQTAGTHLTTLNLKDARGNLVAILPLAGAALDLATPTPTPALSPLPTVAPTQQVSPTAAPSVRVSPSPTLTVRPSVSPSSVVTPSPFVTPVRNLSVRPAPLAFGELTVGKNASAGLTLFSTGNAPLRVGAAEITGPAATDFTITGNNCVQRAFPPNARCIITIAFAPRQAGRRAAQLRFNSDAANSPHFVTLTGVALPPPARLTINPPVMDFGTVNSRTRPRPQPLTISNEGGTAFTIRNLTLREASTFAFRDENCLNQPVAPNQSCRAALAFTPRGAGAFEDVLRIESDAPGSPHFVRLRGQLQPTTPTPDNTPQLTVRPDTLKFRYRIKDEDDLLSDTVAVRNTGGGLLQLSELTLDGADARDFSVSSNCAPEGLPPGRECRLTVRFKPNLRNTERRRVARLLAPHNGANTTQTVGLRGEVGFEREREESRTAFELKPRELNFGNLAVGQSSKPLPIRLVNTGTTVLALAAPRIEIGRIGSVIDRISGAQLARSFRLSANTCEAQLGPGNSCELAVTFSPQRAGSLTASVTLTVNGQAQSVTLRGAGVEPTPDREQQTVSCCVNGKLSNTTLRECRAQNGTPYQTAEEAKQKCKPLELRVRPVDPRLLRRPTPTPTPPVIK
jgi:hypothetical protein